MLKKTLGRIILECFFNFLLKLTEMMVSFLDATVNIF